MEPHEFSKTAFLVAGYRARATASGRAICDDPWASELAGDTGQALTEQYDRIMPDTEFWISLRTRHIDECVRAAVARGIRQVVVLGAGLDTRAARMAREGVRFFEVDRPASQATKRTGLGALAGYPVDAATYVECDFEQDDFVELLEEAGLDRHAPALFILEGLVYYLVEEDVRDLFERIASSFASGSCVVFDHFDIDNPVEEREDVEIRFDNAKAKDFLTDVGETPRSGIDDPRPLLQRCGFNFARTTSFADLAIEYAGDYELDMDFHKQWITVASPARKEL